MLLNFWVGKIVLEIFLLFAKNPQPEAFQWTSRNAVVRFWCHANCSKKRSIVSRGYGESWSRNVSLLRSQSSTMNPTMNTYLQGVSSLTACFGCTAVKGLIRGSFCGNLKPILLIPRTAPSRPQKDNGRKQKQKAQCAIAPFKNLTKLRSVLKSRWKRLSSAFKSERLCKFWAFSHKAGLRVWCHAYCSRNAAWCDAVLEKAGSETSLWCATNPQPQSYNEHVSVFWGCSHNPAVPKGSKFLPCWRLRN